LKQHLLEDRERDFERTDEWEILF